jgi:hypothetical protein
MCLHGRACCLAHDKGADAAPCRRCCLVCFATASQLASHPDECELQQTKHTRRDQDCENHGVGCVIHCVTLYIDQRGLASLGPPSSRGRLGSLALPFAGATRPCVARARTSRRVPPAGLRCAVSPSPRLQLFRPVSRPVRGFGVSGSASLCVA